MNKMEIIRILNESVSRLDNITVEDETNVDISFIIYDIMTVIWELESEVEKVEKRGLITLFFFCNYGYFVAKKYTALYGKKAKEQKRALKLLIFYGGIYYVEDYVYLERRICNT